MHSGIDKQDKMQSSMILIQATVLRYYWQLLLQIKGGLAA